MTSSDVRATNALLDLRGRIESDLAAAARHYGIDATLPVHAIPRVIASGSLRAVDYCAPCFEAGRASNSDAESVARRLAGAVQESQLVRDGIVRIEASAGYVNAEIDATALMSMASIAFPTESVANGHERENLADVIWLDPCASNQSLESQLASVIGEVATWVRGTVDARPIVQDLAPGSTRRPRRGH